MAPVKKKMQNVDFKSVDDLLLYLPEDELKVTAFLRKIVFDVMPDCEEKLSFNVPFFKRHANICFIWPGSVSWGSVTQKGVRLGFAKGYLMADEIGYLDKGNRKQVYWKDFYDIKEINVELLRSYIQEAYLIDQEGFKMKLSKHK